jgi:Cupin
VAGASGRASFAGSSELRTLSIRCLPHCRALLRLDISKAASRDWVETSVRFAAAEFARGRLASSSVMSRLSEVLLVEAVREYISTLGDREQGWLKGLSDTNIGRALAIIHGDIAAP